MSKRRQFVVVVATDGSAEARAAVATTVAFPWPRGTRIDGVVARRRLRTFQRPRYFVEAYGRVLDGAARAAERALRRRWPDATVAVEDTWAADAILDHARRRHAAVIVLGSRRRGVAERLLLGTVSRRVVRQASCAVLIVRGRPPAVTRIALGVDGSANSRRAVSVVAALQPPRGGRVALIRVVEPLRPPSLGLAPEALRRLLARETAVQNAGAIRKARHELELVARRLRRAGWAVRVIVPVGNPLPELMATAATTRAHLLAVGARGVGGVKRLLLGSVAEGVLNRARVSVLVAR